MHAEPSERQVMLATGDEVHFKTRRTTKISKLQDAFANKVGKNVKTLRCVLLRLIDTDDTKHPHASDPNTDGNIVFRTTGLKLTTTIRPRLWTWKITACSPHMSLPLYILSN